MNNKNTTHITTTAQNQDIGPTNELNNQRAHRKLGQSCLRRFLMITLSHAERRELSPQDALHRILNTFHCHSVFVSKEQHAQGGYHYHIGVWNQNASRNTATKNIRNAFTELAQL